MSEEPKTMAALEDDLCGAQTELQRIERQAKDARERSELLSRASKNLDRRALELNHLCDEAATKVLEVVIQHFGSCDDALPANVLKAADSVVAERALLTKCQSFLRARVDESRLLSRAADARRDYQAAAVAEVEAQIEERQFAAKLAAAGLGPGLVLPVATDYQRHQDAAAAKKQKAIRVLTGVEEQLSAWRDRWGAVRLFV